MQLLRRLGQEDRKFKVDRQGRHQPLISALERQRRVGLLAQGQPDLHSEYQDSQGYTKNPALKNKKAEARRMVSLRPGLAI